MIQSHSSHDKMCIRWVLKMFMNRVQFCAQAKCKHSSSQINRLEYAAFTQTGSLFLKHQVSIKAYSTICVETRDCIYKPLITIPTVQAPQLDHH